MERDLDAADRLVTLHGTSRPVGVIAPVGRIGPLLPHWASTTELGGDPAGFGLGSPDASSHDHGRDDRRPGAR